MPRISDRVANSFWGMFSKRLVSRFELGVLAYYKKYGRNTPGALAAIKGVWRKDHDKVLLSPHEAWMILSLAKAHRDHGGKYAEVGVFKGASAELICLGKTSETELFLFDTFEGLPAPEAYDPRFQKGMFSAPEDVVRARLKDFAGWKIFKGTFPDTAAAARDQKFSFVHLDMDLYKGTLAALEFFWPRLLPGGIILSHDYSQCEGVAKAFEEFLAERHDYRFVELSVSQAMLLKN